MLNEITPPSQKVTMDRLIESAFHRLKNATVHRSLYHEEHKFAPTEGDVTQMRALANLTELENRRLSQYLTERARAVGNRAQFDKKWIEGNMAYVDARALVAEARESVANERKEAKEKKRLQKATNSEKLAEIRAKTRESYDRRKTLVS
jgi:hypothetical protein